jgi:hypothetical protein
MQSPPNDTYSATLYGDLAMQTLRAYNESDADARPLFFYLPWQVGALQLSHPNLSLTRTLLPSLPQP